MSNDNTNTEGQSVDEKIGTEAEAKSESVQAGDPAEDATGAAEVKSEETDGEKAEGEEDKKEEAKTEEGAQA